MTMLRARRSGVDLRNHPLVKGTRGPFRSIATLAAAKDTAEFADGAARAMAEHCDKRIEKMRRVLRKINKYAIAGQNGSANAAVDSLTVIRKLAELAVEE